jgi:hypothetical protein
MTRIVIIWGKRKRGRKTNNETRKEEKRFVL